MNMDDRKITISRSYSRKINLQNYDPERAYENVDLFASYSIELPVGTSEEEIKKQSDELFNKAKGDVEPIATKLIDNLRK